VQNFVQPFPSFASPSSHCSPGSSVSFGAPPTQRVVIPSQAGSALPPLQTSLAPVPPAIDFHAQLLSSEQKVLSKPVEESAMLKAVAATPEGAPDWAKMLIGVSPRFLPTSFTRLVGLITTTLAPPGPKGATLFTYLATVVLLTSHSGNPALARNSPDVAGLTPLSYVKLKVTPMVVGSVPFDGRVEVAVEIGLHGAGPYPRPTR